MKTLNYDAVIIGFGKGGKTLAAKLAAAGKTVALAEEDPGMYGGTCINVGCIPSKSLILSASGVAADASQEEKDDAFRRAVLEKRRLTAMLRQKNYEKLSRLENVDIFTGTARFTAPLSVEVSLAEETVLLNAGQVFINTGSKARIPPIPGLETTPGVYTSRELMDLERRPRRLAILGGGYIGLEFASMFAAFGSSVTVLQDSGVFLPREDREIAAEIRRSLEAQGVIFHLNANTRQVEPGKAGPIITVELNGREKRLEADALLVATGRIPNTGELNCQAAGVELTSRGAIKVDEFLRTTAPNTWAMGDAAGGPQHTYVSLDDSRIVWDQLAGKAARSTDSRTNVPYSVFLKTPYSRVGMNETEARQAGLEPLIFKLPAGAVPKAQVLKAPEGFLKAVVDPGSGAILGAMLLCEESYETINVIKLAIDMGAEYTLLRDQIFTHPTMTEALNDLFAG